MIGKSLKGTGGAAGKSHWYTPPAGGIVRPILNFHQNWYFAREVRRIGQTTPVAESRTQGCFQSHLGIFIPVGLCLDVSVSSWRPALHTRSGGEGRSGEEGMAGFSHRRRRESLPLCLSFPCPCGRLPSEAGSAFPPLLGPGPVTCSDPKDEVGQSASH